MSAPAVVSATEVQKAARNVEKLTPRWRGYLLIFLAYFTVAVILQWCSGVYSSELSHYPDESAHVTTALMIHDYITAGLPSTPMQYAEQYYIHYPKVSFGMWPPLFHSVAALWMLIFRPAPISMLLFMAVQSAVLALMSAVFARRIFSTMSGLCIGLLVIFIPLIQYETSMFMLDLMVAILELTALILIVDYFRTERARPAILFGVVTALAMLTKANANALVLVPVMLLLVTRKFYLLRRRALYIAGACVVLIGGPWQFVSFRFLAASVPMKSVNASYMAHMISDYFIVFYHHLGAAILALAVLGIGVEVGSIFTKGRRMSARDMNIAVAFCLLAAIIAFHSGVPTPADQRYVIPAIPLLLLFFLSGAQFLGRLKVGPVTSETRSVVVAVLALVSFTLTTFAVPARNDLGFRAVYESLKSSAYKVMLVCSDSLGEGALITQVALGEHRPDRFVLRGSKILSENTWILTRYRPFFQNTNELQEFLSTTVDAVIVDLSQTLWEQDRALVLQTIKEHPASWELVPITGHTEGGRKVMVYRRVGPPLQANREIRVPMQIMLGRDLYRHP